MAKMIYQRTGGPMVHWDRGRAPAANSRGNRELSGLEQELGSLGSDGISYATIPRAGGPEILSGDDAKSALEEANDTVHSGVGRKIAAAASAFHGYKRNNSIGMALVWAACGYITPVLTPVIAVAQGYAKPRGGG